MILDFTTKKFGEIESELSKLSDNFPGEFSVSFRDGSLVYFPNRESLVNFLSGYQVCYNSEIDK